MCVSSCIMVICLELNQKLTFHKVIWKAALETAAPVKMNDELQLCQHRNTNNCSYIFKFWNILITIELQLK